MYSSDAAPHLYGEPRTTSGSRTAAHTARSRRETAEAEGSGGAGAITGSAGVLGLLGRWDAAAGVTVGVSELGSGLTAGGAVGGVTRGSATPCEGPGAPDSRFVSAFCGEMTPIRIAANNDMSAMRTRMWEKSQVSHSQSPSAAGRATR